MQVGLVMQPNKGFLTSADRAARLSAKRSELAHGLHERGKFRAVEPIVRAYAAAQIDAVGPDACNRLTNVVCVDAAGKKDRKIAALHDRARERPIVLATGSSKFLDGEIRIAGVEQEHVNLRRNIAGFVHGLWSDHVNHLHDAHLRQRSADRRVGADFDAVDELNVRRAHAAELFEDLVAAREASEQKCRDVRGY